MDNNPSESNNKSVHKTNPPNLLNDILDANITMDIEKHIYILKDDPSAEMISTTKILSERIFDKFDIEASARKPQSSLFKINKEIPKAHRYEAVLADWEFAKQVGKYFHDAVETYIQTKQITLQQPSNPPPPKKAHMGEQFDEALETVLNRITQSIDNYDPSKLKSEWGSEIVETYVIDEYNQERLFNNISDRIYGFIDVYNLIFKHLKLIATEYMVYDKESGAAGTIDCLFWANEEKREVLIVDWKTCSNFNLYGTKIKNTESPFYNFSKTKLNKYQCQLHIYSKILTKNYNVKVKAGYVILFDKNGAYAVFYKANDEGCPCTTTLFYD